MNKILSTSITGFLTLSLLGCAGVSHQDVGVATGAVLGGVLGSQVGGGAGQTAAIIGGSILGGMIGGAIGNSMDEVDQMKMTRALESNRTNQTSSWTNPDSGNRYSVVPKRTYTSRDGQPCREYTTTAIIGGKKQEIYGTACRTADGCWRVVK
jgi:surface antigen